MVSSPRLRRSLDRLELDVQLLDLLRALRGSPPGSASMSRPSRLRARRLVAGGVLLALEPFELGQQAAALCFERRELLELGVQVGAAMSQARCERVSRLSRRSAGSSMQSSILYQRS